jgi:hypothetical protein
MEALRRHILWKQFTFDAALVSGKYLSISSEL